VPLLELDQVTVRFGGHVAVLDADLRAEAGEVTGLIGPNGAGKTTLFNVICGLQAPTRGRVLLGGRDVTHQPTHARARWGLARTFQRLELFGSLTARENLEVAGEVGGRDLEYDDPWSKRTIAQRVDEVVDRCMLGGFASQRADGLSTGQARLVELGRALMTRPRLLLLDEPASGLDADETGHFSALLTGLAAEGLGILLVEHDVPLVMEVCNRITVLDYGRVIADSDPATVRADEAVVAAYLGASTTTPAEEVAGA
jgi:branched-chain amino acid transport system ATP-binding protein